MHTTLRLPKKSILLIFSLLFQLSNGEILVEYNDGSQMWVNCDSSGRVLFRAAGSADVIEYGRQSYIPKNIVDKLAQVPRIVADIMRQPTPANSYQHYR